jgi:hypothetical protein
MKQTTTSFLKRYDKTKNLRGAISMQVKEDRFYFYADSLRGNTKVMAQAKKGDIGAMTDWLKHNEASLNLPIKLTHRGLLRTANYLVNLVANGG